MASLEERLEAGYAEAWRPDQEDPDTLVGVVADISTNESDYGEYPIITIRQDDGTEKAVHAVHTVLRNELIKQRPQIGERIGIKFLGDIKTKPGSRYSSYKGYSVRMERDATTAFNWSTLGLEAEATDVNPAFTPAAEPEPTAIPATADDSDDGIPF